MPKLGILSKFYVNTSAAPEPSRYTNPGWEVLPTISDCMVNGTWEEGDASARHARVTLTEPTKMAIEITGKVRVKGSEFLNAYTVMYAAWLNDRVLDVLVLNGAITEEYAEGFRFQGKVFGLSEDQGLGVVLYKDFTIKPCIPFSNSQNLTFFNPAVVKVVSGVLTSAYIGQG